MSTEMQRLCQSSLDSILTLGGKVKGNNPVFMSLQDLPPTELSSCLVVAIEMDVAVVQATGQQQSAAV